MNERLARATQRIREVYSPSLFQSAGEALISHLSRHLEMAENSRGSVLNWTDPRDLTDIAAAALENGNRGALLESLRTSGESATSRISGPVEEFSRLVQTALSHGINLHDPRYVGHQVPAPIPLSGLFDCIGAVTNNPMAIYEMGPFATAAEQSLLQTLIRSVGWSPEQSAGIVTHGASVANLTAILVARNVCLPHSWEKGVASEQNRTGGKSPCLVVQADAHYCIGRSAGILGLGTENIISADVDHRRRMDPQKLDETLAKLRSDGRPIIAVAASSCATPIGAFDPLREIADVCRRHDVWLHVDAAHGGPVLLSEAHRHLLDGIDQADSLTWDAHKMMFVPALCAFLLYKDRRHSYEAFRQNAPYLFDPLAPGQAEYDGGLRTLECTKRGAALGLWGVWSMFGSQLLADLVDVTFALAQSLYERLEAAKDFVALHEPQCNIVAFRHIPDCLATASPDVIGAFQMKLRRAVIESGEYYLVPTSQQGYPALRCTLMNPLTTESHLDELLETLRRFGKTILSS